MGNTSNLQRSEHKEIKGVIDDDDDPGGVQGQRHRGSKLKGKSPASSTSSTTWRFLS